MEDLVKILIEKGYNEKQALSVANDLSQIDEKLKPALDHWMHDGLEEDYFAEGISLIDLMKQFEMTYPAALLSVDWIIKEPVSALEAIKKGIR